MDILKAVLPCLIGERDSNGKNNNTKKTEVPQPTEEEIASNIVSILFSTEKRGRELDRILQDQVYTCGWYEGLAKRILDGVVALLNAGAAMGGVMKDSFDKASKEVETFVKEHPILTTVVVTLVAMGILALLTPWAISALGFGELGPIEGSFAASWQSTFPNVTYGSWFSFFQRLGMTLGK